MTGVHTHDVVIVGAGFGGLGAAIAFRRMGIDDLVIVEREDDLGGTWHVNRYPGLAVDGAKWGSASRATRATQAYQGIAVPGFPNFLTLSSPYSYSGLSYFTTIATQMRHITRLFGELRRRDARTFEVTERANAAFLDRVTDLLDDAVFTRGACSTTTPTPEVVGGRRHTPRMATFSATDDLRGAEFRGADLTGARFVACDFADIVVRGSEIRQVELDSPWLFEGDGPYLRVNGVDVLPLVDAELDRRFPGRGERFATTPAGLRSAWEALDRTWRAAVDRVAAMPAGTSDVSVAGEWTFAQTLRHVVLATDVWLGGAILRNDQPYHPLGLPFTGAERAGMDMSVFSSDEPDYEQVLNAHADRVTMVREYLADVTPDDLARPCTNPWDPDHDLTVLECAHTILHEGWEHYRYAVRDLDAIEAGAT